MQGFRELVQLHLAHAAERGAAKHQDQLRERIAELEQAVDAARSRLELADGDARRLQSDRKAAEHEVQKLEDQRAKYRSQLMSAKTNEIYKTLISEIETTGKMISERETSVLVLLEQADDIATRLAEAKAALASAQAARDAETKRLQGEIAALDDERAAARQRAEALLPGVPSALRTHYDRLYNGRDGRALAEAVGSSCTECHIQIRPQDWVDLLAPEKAISCSGCYRILYRKETLEHEQRT